MGQDSCEKGKNFMKKKTTKRTDQPVGNLAVIADFLPRPELLLPERKQMKITLNLDADTIKFFKGMASKNKMKYQRMMREVLNIYARKYRG